MHLLIAMPGTFFFVVLVVCALLIPVLALVDIVRSEFNTPDIKIIWVLIVLLMPFIGPVLYLIFGRPQRKLQQR